LHDANLSRTARRLRRIGLDRGAYYQTDGRFVNELAMPRTLDPAAHALKRDAFIDVAQRLIQTKGYQQLSVDEILAELGASKGAFYHYFDSKEDLLAAVVDRIVDVATATLAPIAADPNLTAVEKLSDLFSSLARWKGERTDLMLELVQVWFSDANAVVRDRLRSGTQAGLTPLLATIVGQGKAEGTFSVASPEHTAAVLVSMLLGTNEIASRLFLARQAGAVSFQDVECTFAAHAEAFERVLGLPAGSWPQLDPQVMHFWFG
jgi:AcrR family transcriptional regulator